MANAQAFGILAGILILIVLFCTIGGNAWKWFLGIGLLCGVVWLFKR